MRNRYIVCYDVSDPQRLSKTYKKMCGYGNPVQYSVFECELNDKEIIYMREELEFILNLKEDRVLIVNIGPASTDVSRRITTIGVPLKPREKSAIVI